MPDTAVGSPTAPVDRYRTRHAWARSRTPGTRYASVGSARMISPGARSGSGSGGEREVLEHRNPPPWRRHEHQLCRGLARYVEGTHANRLFSLWVPIRETLAVNTLLERAGEFPQSCSNPRQGCPLRWASQIPVWRNANHVSPPRTRSSCRAIVTAHKPDGKGSYCEGLSGTTTDSIQSSSCASIPATRSAGPAVPPRPGCAPAACDTGHSCAP